MHWRGCLGRVICTSRAPTREQFTTRSRRPLEDSWNKPMAERENNEVRDRRVLELYEKVLEIEQRLIPTGLHVFGRPSNEAEIADLLRMVASFDRPELGIRSLPDLVAEGLGLPPYP